jgi:hypothetical protein
MGSVTGPTAEMVVLLPIEDLIAQMLASKRRRTHQPEHL